MERRRVVTGWRQPPRTGVAISYGRATLIVTLGALFYAYAMMLQVLPAALIPTLVAEFGLNGARLGLLSAGFYLSYAPGQLAAGYLVGRWGSRAVLVGALFVSVVAGLLLASAQHYHVLWLARLLMGAGCASAFVCALSLITDWMPANYYAVLSGVIGSLGALGGAAGSTPIAMLLTYLSWRAVVLVLTLVAALLLVLTLFLLPKVATKSCQMASIQNCPPSQQQSCWTIGLARLAMVRTEGWLVAGYSLLIWAPMLSFVMLWSVPFFQLKMQLASRTIHNLIVTCWLSIALCSPLLGWLSQSLKDRLWLMLLCALAGFSAMLLLLWVHLPLAGVVCCMVSLGLASAGQSLSFMWISDYYAAHQVSTINGLVNAAIVIGGIWLPGLVGVLLDYQNSLLQSDYDFSYDATTALHFSLQNYQNALIIIPGFYLCAGVLIGIMLLRRSYKSQ